MIRSVQGVRTDIALTAFLVSLCGTASGHEMNSDEAYVMHTTDVASSTYHLAIDRKGGLGRAGVDSISSEGENPIPTESSSMFGIWSTS